MAVTDQTETRPAPSFATHRPLRLAGLFLMYAAQGVPEGLLYVAVPSWLAAQGTDPALIGGYIAVILLPWSFKLINGALMDRVTYLPMGRRRPWIIGAMAILALTLFAFGARVPSAESLAWITATGFLVNLAAAFQDVAIDGMAIEVVPESERAQANGVMWGGKTLGIAASSVANGWIIARYGYAEAAVATAITVAIVLFVPLLLRERPGERLLPWTRGHASEIARAEQLRRWWPILTNLFRAATRPRALLLAAGIFIALGGYGVDTAIGPVMSVTDLGFTEETYGQLSGWSNLAGGLFAVFLCGLIANRFGAWRMLIITLIAMAALQGGLALVPGAITSATAFSAYTVTYQMLFVLMSVTIYAIAMNLSEPRVAATQFALFMAFLNLGTSFGAARYSDIQPLQGNAAAFLLAAGFALVAAIIFAVARGLARREPA